MHDRHSTEKFSGSKGLRSATRGGHRNGRQQAVVESQKSHVKRTAEYSGLGGAAEAAPRLVKLFSVPCIAKETVGTCAEHRA